MNFSVLISVYYKEDPTFLEDALNSIEQQTLTPNEIVLVKDGPLTPALEHVITSHVEQAVVAYKIVSLTKNVGLGKALNIGITACTFKWVARMDSDDISHTDRFEKQIHYLTNNPSIDILGTWICEFDTDIRHCESLRKTPATHQEILKYAKYSNPINHMSVIFKKSAVVKAGSYKPMQGFEDYYLWIRLLQQGSRFANLDEILVNVRRGEEMLQRRRGWVYIQNEWRFAHTAKKLQFLNYFEFYRNIILRISPRILPSFILKKLYNAVRKH